MKIAYIISSKNVIDSRRIGGVECSAYYLIKELNKKKHSVTLFSAHGSSLKNIKTIAISKFSTNINIGYANLKERVSSFYDLNFLSQFFREKKWKDYDILHYDNYLFYEILPFVNNIKIPLVIRINYPHDLIFKYLDKRICNKKNIHYLPVSKHITNIMPGLNYLTPIYPTIDFDDFPLSKKGGDYLLFLGRICPEKGTHIAIDVARKLNMNLVIAGKVDINHYYYFNSQIKPHIDNKKIIFVGEVDFKTRVKIYQRAAVTLFPIQWDEPSGLVPIESASCGTPVVTFCRAAMGELLKNKKNGILVKDNDVDLMAKAVIEARQFNREEVMRHTKNKLSIDIWTEKYLKIIKNL